MNKIISYVKKYPLLGVAVVFIGIVIAFIGIEWLRRFLNSKGCDISVAECYMTVGTFISAVATACMAWIAYDGNKQNKVGIEASQRQAEAASEQTKAIQQQIEISKQQTKAAEKQAEAAIQSLKEAYRPRLTVYFERKHAYKLQLVIKNIGNMPASGIDMQTTASWLEYETQKNTNLWHVLNQKITYLAPGQKEALVFDTFDNFYACTPVQVFMLQAEPLRVSLSYTDGEQSTDDKRNSFRSTLDVRLPESISVATDDALPNPENMPFLETLQYLTDFVGLFTHRKLLPIDAPQALKNLEHDIAYIYDFVEKRMRNADGNSKSFSDLNFSKCCTNFDNLYKKIQKEIQNFRDRIVTDFYRISKDNKQSELLDFETHPLLYLTEHWFIEDMRFATQEKLNGRKQLFDSREDKISENDLKEFLSQIDAIRFDSEKNFKNKIYKLFRRVADFYKRYFPYRMPNRKTASVQPEHLLNLVSKSVADALKKEDLTYGSYPIDSQLTTREVTEKQKQEKQKLPTNEIHNLLCMYLVYCELREFIFEHPFKNISQDHYLSRLCSILILIKNKAICTEKADYVKKALYQLTKAIFEEFSSDFEIAPSLYYSNICNYRNGKRSEFNGFVDSSECSGISNPNAAADCPVLNLSFFFRTHEILKSFFAEHKELDGDYDSFRKFLTEP